MSLITLGSDWYSGSHTPSGSAAANAESCECATTRRLIRAVGPTFSIAATAAASPSCSSTEAVTSIPTLIKASASGFLGRGRVSGLHLALVPSRGVLPGVDAELGGVNVVLDHPRRLGRGQDAVEQRDALARNVAMRSEQLPEDGLHDGGARRVGHLPGDRDRPVVVVGARQRVRARGPHVLPAQRRGRAGRAGVLDRLGRGGVVGRPDDLTQPLGVDGGRSARPRVGQGAVQPGEPHADLVGLLGGR